MAISANCGVSGNMDGHIKITGEDNLFYDSINNEYRYRMHCPYCGKVSGCWCYGIDIDEVPMFDEDRANVYCCDVHFVVDVEECKEIADILNIKIKPTMEEWNASKIVKVFMAEIDGNDEYHVGPGCLI